MSVVSINSMQYKFCVIEIEQKKSEIILINTATAQSKSCWNILYSIPFEPSDEEESMLAFNGCLAWVEQNKVEGSKYVIMEMFFV